MSCWWQCCPSSCARDYEEFLQESEPFSLPSPLPQWPKGKGFATGKISLGEVEVVQITEFDQIWSCRPLLGMASGVTFYEPSGIPAGYFSLGHYCQPSDQKLRGYVLAAKCISSDASEGLKSNSPALEKPLSYTLVWGEDTHRNGCGYIWLPNPPKGYKAMGFVVTTGADEPDLEGVRCVRADLTESCEVGELIYDRNGLFSSGQFYVWNTRPCERGMLCRGVPVGTFYCSRDDNSSEELSIACLKNLDSSLMAMPNLNQVHALIKHYGPTLYFHPDEVYLPSSVPWFFENGSLLYKEGMDKGLAIDSNGSILPSGGINDGEFWLDLPEEDKGRDYVKVGSIETAELYVHVKSASGGAFTDIAMWIFCPFNGPATIKVGSFNFPLDTIGEHIGDWEHYTLRVSNFNGELWSVYYSEHSGGRWVDASELEFINGNKAIVYASKNGHASFAHEGCYIQGSSKLGIGARNDCAKSNYSVDSSTRYQIVAAEYLGDIVAEPPWLQYMREWGPTIVYSSATELDKILNDLPFFLRFSLESLIELFPTELYGEEGPTGPKEKDNWLGDERC
ncbi:vacuolar sorting-associated protein [Perilla frutescens var. hirtella]|nr:vacuolar sorting-associated protein [Perilla frutescens var. frutescens]KAH6784262.1 vacuolar sorting-associated protein [Perilla frutescens var. hirtella]